MWFFVDKLLNTEQLVVVYVLFIDYFTKSKLEIHTRSKPTEFTANTPLREDLGGTNVVTWLKTLWPVVSADESFYMDFLILRKRSRLEEIRIPIIWASQF